jgi:hypothetical protein
LIHVRCRILHWFLAFVDGGFLISRLLFLLIGRGGLFGCSFCFGGAVPSSAWTVVVPIVLNNRNARIVKARKHARINLTIVLSSLYGGLDAICMEKK